MTGSYQYRDIPPCTAMYQGYRTRIPDVNYLYMYVLGTNWYILEDSGKSMSQYSESVHTWGKLEKYVPGPGIYRFMSVISVPMVHTGTYSVHTSMNSVHTTSTGPSDWHDSRCPTRSPGVTVAAHCHAGPVIG